MPTPSDKPRGGARRRARRHGQDRSYSIHELGRPEVTEHEIGHRTYLVAEVEPLDVDGVRTVAVGSVLWLITAVALLPFIGTLQDTGRVDWLWTCIAGFGLGLIGVEYCRRRRKALRADPEKRTGETSPLGAAGL